MLKSFNKRFGWTTGAGLLIALLLATSLVITPASAANPPAPWETEWLTGTVTINGAAATTGTAVSIYVNGTSNASTTVDSSGRYGYTPQVYITGSDGQPITFKVGIADAPQTATFAGGTSARINLAISTTGLSVSTNDASGVSSNAATLNGNLTNMGGFNPVTVYFLYGTTTAYGSTTSQQTQGATGGFTAAITTLAPNTMYYFQAVAKYGSTVVYGNQFTFTTSPSALTVTTTAATVVTASGATLNGNLTDLGSNSSVNVYFEYGTDQGFGTSTTAQLKTSAGIFSASLPGLLSNTKYYFRSVAAGATTTWGSTFDFTTSIGTLSVTTLSATQVSSTTANLNGTLSSLGANQSANVYFNYGTSASYGITTPLQPLTSPGSFSASLSGLSPNTTYYFQAVAVGATTVPGANIIFPTLPSGGGSTSPPNQFYGTVYVGGARARIGTTVVAYFNGAPATTTATDSSGRYGYASLFYVPGTPSGTVTFYVNGISTGQTATWASGGVNRLDLYSTQPVLAVTCSAAYATTTSATLIGTVTSFGTGDTSAAVSFEWGTSSTALTPLAATPSPVTEGGSFTAPITGLTTGTTYYYRAKAVGNTSGIVYCPTSGTNSYIHTPPNILTVTTVDSSCSGTTATINGNLTSMGVYSTVNVSFLYGSDPTLTTSTETTLQPESAPGTYSAQITVPSGQTYYFRAKAIGNVTGATAVYGSILQVCGSQTPPSVSTVSSACASTTATLNGNLTSLGTYSSVLVSFEYGPSSTLASPSETTPVAQTTTRVYSANITVPSGQTYYFRAKAIGNVTGATPVYATNIFQVCGVPVICGSDPIGCTSGTPYGQATGNSIWYCRYPAISSTTINHINLIAASPATIMVAIYSDNGGAIGTRQNATTLVPIVAGLNTISITGTPITSGTYYWLAFWSSRSIVPSAFNESGTTRFQYNPGMTTFPTTISDTVYELSGRLLISGVQ